MIVAEHVVALSPALHCIVIDSASVFGVGECIEEVRVEEVHPID